MDDLPPGIDLTGRPYPVHSVADPDRARGALLGLAVGDALGTTLEFTTPRLPPLPELLRGPHREIIGRGPFDLAAGQVTDDSQMAACLAASLRERGRLDVDDLASRYLRWQEVAFDVGGQTGGVLGRIARGESPLAASRAVWEEGTGPRRPAGNGSLMRTAPIGVFFAGQPDDLVAASLDESAITHFDPRCRLACAGLNAAIAALAYELRGRREAAAAAVLGVDAGARLLLDRDPGDAEHVRSAHLALREDIEAADSPDPGLWGGEVDIYRSAGYVRVAFRLAFWHLLHTESFVDAVVDVANRGGDADTNAAITGALLGAACGEGGIPSQWRDTVLGALADSPGSPFAGEYHPRALLTLVRGSS